MNGRAQRLADTQWAAVVPAVNEREEGVSVYLAANLSMLFDDRPMSERFGAAAAAGFSTVEIQFPHFHPLEELQRARDAAGVDIVLINVPAGDPEAGEAGLASLPGREADFRAAVDTCLDYARGLGARKINVLAGKPPADAPREEIWKTLTGNLRLAADRLGEAGLAVQVEAINPVDVPGFFLNSLDAGLEALARAERENLQLQFDFYHMAITEPSLNEAITRAGPHIGHVQFADNPGRHEPGTGSLDLLSAIAALRATGYDDALAAEYRPAGRTEDGLGWMADFTRAIS